MIQSLTRAISSVSVRTRIVGIALIPVVGFLANGISFTTGQKDVTNAFDNVEAASALSDASREFKIALVSMQFAATDFVAMPSGELVRNFEANHVLAAANFDKIAAATGALNEEDINRVRQKLGELKLAFGYLADEQAELGFTEDQGTRKRLDDAAAGIEQAINDGMTWITQADREKLLLSLLTMRRQEAQYRLNQSSATWELFFKEFREFEAILRQLPAQTELKQQLARRVQDYASTLAQWNRYNQNIQRSLKEIADTSQQLVPQAHAIVATAQERTNAATAALAGSQSHTRWHHHPGRLRRGADRAGVQLADRPQHHAAARRPGAGDDAARRRRHLRPHPRHQGQGRARRHGAHRHRVPRHHDRARTAGRRARPPPTASARTAAR